MDKRFQVVVLHTAPRIIDTKKEVVHFPLDTAPLHYYKDYEIIASFNTFLSALRYMNKLKFGIKYKTFSKKKLRAKAKRNFLSCRKIENNQHLLVKKLKFHVIRTKIKTYRILLRD